MADSPTTESGEPGGPGLSRAEILAGSLTSPVLTAMKAALAILLTLGSLAWSSDLFRTIGLNILDEQIMGSMLGLGLMLVYIIFPARRGAEKTSVPWYDWVAALLGFLPRLIKFVAYSVLFGILYYLFNGPLDWGFENAMISASVIAVVVGLVTKSGVNPMPLGVIYDALYETGTSILDLLMIAAGASFIIGILSVTGLGYAFTLLFVEFGSQNLFLLLVIAAFLCIILGMGMPTIAVYIILAVLVAPSLVDLGIMPIAAHMFVMYLGMMSFLTPPVAIAAFFAASMADAPPMATGWTSMRFGWTAYVVPFLFVFSPSLLLQDPNVALTLITVTTAIAGVWLISAAMIGYLFRLMAMPMRAGVLASGILLLTPTGFGSWVVTANAIGAVAAVLILGIEFTASRRASRVRAD